MLDRKTKDIDASVELLEDRKKGSRIIFIIFFIIGWSAIVASAFIVPYKYDDIGFGMGIAFLIFATWFVMDMKYYNTMIMIKRLDKKE